MASLRVEFFGVNRPEPDQERFVYRASVELAGLLEARVQLALLELKGEQLAEIRKVKDLVARMDA